MAPSMASAIRREALDHLAGTRLRLSRLDRQRGRPRRLRAASDDGSCAAPPLCGGACRESRPSACSRRWPAAFRWSARRGSDEEGLFRPGPDFLVARDTARDDPAPEGAAARSRTLPRRWRPAGCSASGSAIPAPIGWTSCSPSSPRSAAAPLEARRNEDRDLRIQPAVVLLERRRDLLPRHPAGAGAAWPRHHVLRAGRLRPAEPSRYRAAALVPRGRLSSRPRPVCATCWRRPRAADVVIKASGVGVYRRRTAGRRCWRMPPPTRCASSGTWMRRRLWPRSRRRRIIRCARALPQLDIVLTYGGGDPWSSAYRGAWRARTVCRSTTRLIRRRIIRCRPRNDIAADLTFLGNRLPDRERRVDEFFLEAAARLPASGGSCSAAPAGPTSRARRTSSSSGMCRPRPITR